MTDPPSLPALTQLFAELGAADPERWARAALAGGASQLARFLFLREGWRQVLGDGDTRWIDPTIRSAALQPDAPFAGVGAALERLRAVGAADADLTTVARGMQAALLFAVCRVIDEPPSLEPEAGEVRWALVQLDAEGRPVAPIAGLAEAVLATDPTGREMRPRSGG